MKTEKEKLICDNCLKRMGMWIANKVAAVCVSVWMFVKGGITRSPKK